MTVDFAVARSQGDFDLANLAWNVALGARIGRAVDVHALAGRSFVGGLAFGVGFGLGYVGP